MLQQEVLSVNAIILVSYHHLNEKPDLLDLINTVPKCLDPLMANCSQSSAFVYFSDGVLLSVC